MKFSRDSLLWTLGIAGALLTYLIADGRNPLTWDYLSAIKFFAAVVATLAAKLSTSPLDNKATLRMAHPHKTIVMLALAVGLAGALGCASPTARLDIVDGSHDALAIAQDLEAHLCWGVTRVTDPVPDRLHCTSPVAATIGLTDARHQGINARLGPAFRLHRDLTAQAKAGATIDPSRLQAIIAEILALVGQLQPTPTVTQLTAAVTAGGHIR